MTQTTTSQNQTSFSFNGRPPEIDFDPNKYLASPSQIIWLIRGRRLIVRQGTCLALCLSDTQRKIFKAGAHIVPDWTPRRAPAQWVRTAPISIPSTQARCKDGLQATLALEVIPVVRETGPLANLALALEDVVKIIQSNLCAVLAELPHNELMGFKGHTAIKDDHLSKHIAWRLQQQVIFEGLDFHVIITERRPDESFIKTLVEKIHITREQELEEARLNMEIALMDRRLELERKRQEMHMLKTQGQLDERIADATVRATMGRILLPLRKQEYEMKTRLQEAVNKNQFAAARELFTNYAQILQQYIPFMQMDDMLNIPAHAGLGVEGAVLNDVYRQGVTFLRSVKHFLDLSTPPDMDWLDESDEHPSWPPSHNGGSQEEPDTRHAA
ncbi:MAG: hypothetical protein JXB47_07265 [Anaerolineae bacterium]|nr:hypothetical protein [Anaerolineae bacterium]